MFASFATGYQLAKQSLSVLRSEPQIVIFPIISSIALILVILSFVPLFALSSGGIYHRFQTWQGFVLLFLFYFVQYLIITFFNVGLITCAYMRLTGAKPSIGAGFQNALYHLDQIVIWALIAASVGTILRTLSDQSHPIGRLLIGLIGVAWSLLTYFVVPIIIFENVNAFRAIPESASLFKRTWGQNIGGRSAIGVFFFLLGMIGIVPFMLGFYSGSTATFFAVAAIVVLYWVALSLASSTLNGIFLAALYIYAKTGKLPSGYYDPSLVQQAFGPAASGESMTQI